MNNQEIISQFVEENQNFLKKYLEDAFKLYKEIKV